jgi:hypothetical protein
LAPDDGVGIMAMTNGSSGAFSWLQGELDVLLRSLLAMPDGAEHRELPHHPEIWSGLCGRYGLPPSAADLRQRVMLGAGVEVFVSGGRPMLRLLTPIPVLYRGLPLEPDDERDPYVFRLDTSRLGMAPPRVVFSQGPGGCVEALHTDLGGQPWSLIRRPKTEQVASLAEDDAGGACRCRLHSRNPTAPSAGRRSERSHLRRRGGSRRLNLDWHGWRYRWRHLRQESAMEVLRQRAWAALRRMTNL